MHKADMGSKILKQATKEGEKLRDSFRRFEKCHIRVEFVVGSLLCSKRFSSQYSGFPLSSETNISKFQFHQALLGELCVSLVWISKPVVSRIKEEAMLLLVFTIVFALFSVAVAVLTHLCAVCCHFCFPVSLFQGDVICRILHSQGLE